MTHALSIKLGIIVEGKVILAVDKHTDVNTYRRLVSREKI
jgi:hypothetical protein